LIEILIRFPVHTLDPNLDEFGRGFHTNGLPRHNYDVIKKNWSEWKWIRCAGNAPGKVIGRLRRFSRRRGHVTFQSGFLGRSSLTTCKGAGSRFEVNGDHNHGLWEHGVKE